MPKQLFPALVRDEVKNVDNSGLSLPAGLLPKVGQLQNPMPQGLREVLEALLQIARLLLHQVADNLREKEGKESGVGLAPWLEWLLVNACFHNDRILNGPPSALHHGQVLVRDRRADGRGPLRQRREREERDSIYHQAHDLFRLPADLLKDQT